VRSCSIPASQGLSLYSLDLPRCLKLPTSQPLWPSFVCVLRKCLSFLSEYVFRSFFSSNLFLRSIRLRSQSRASNLALSKSYEADHFFISVEMGKPRKSTRAKRKIPIYEELMARKPTPKKQKLEGPEASGEEKEEEQPKLPEELKAKAITCTPYPTGVQPSPWGSRSQPQRQVQLYSIVWPIPARH
jgi:hypothetical protein